MAAKAVRPKRVSGRFADLFASFGRVTVRPLFGFEGLFAGGTIFGVVVDDRIYLKTNKSTCAPYLKASSKPFTFFKRQTNETIVTSYYSLPERLYDDPEELAEWARDALGVASRSATAKKKRKKQARGAKARRSPNAPSGRRRARSSK